MASLAAAADRIILQIQGFLLLHVASLRARQFGPHGPNLRSVQVNPLGEYAKVIAAVSATLGPHAAALESCLRLRVRSLAP